MNTPLSVQAIIFDLDDTLCGYWDASKAALLEAFETHPSNGHTPEEMVRHWAAAFREFSPTIKRSDWYDVYLKEGGVTRVEQMRRTLALVGVSDGVLAQALADHYGRARNRNLRLFPEAAEVLGALSASYPLGILTNGPADIQREEIETLGIGDSFRGVYIEGEMGEGKPNPSVFSRIERDFGTDAGHLLMVGNSYAHDIRPALEAGWHAVWIRRPSDVPPSATGTAGRPEDRPADSPAPDAEIGDLRELLPLLGLA